LFDPKSADALPFVDRCKTPDTFARWLADMGAHQKYQPILAAQWDDLIAEAVHRKFIKLRWNNLSQTNDVLHGRTGRFIDLPLGVLMEVEALEGAAN